MHQLPQQHTEWPSWGRFNVPLYTGEQVTLGMLFAANLLASNETINMKEAEKNTTNIINNPKSGSVASYDIRPGKRLGLFSEEKILLNIVSCCISVATTGPLLLFLNKNEINEK